MRDNIKRTLQITVAIIVLILCIIILYSNRMTNFFYESSIENIDGLTDEVRRSINSQINSDYNFLSIVNEHLKIFDEPEDIRAKNHVMALPHEENITYDLIFNGKSLITTNDASEETNEISASGDDTGVITNVRVSENERYIAVFKKIIFKNGEAAYFLKKYDISILNDRYTLNMLSGGGSSCIVGLDGTIILAPDHGSIFSVNDNILQMVDNKNRQKDIDDFKNYIENCKSGSVILKYNGNEIVFSVNRLESLSRCTFVSAVSREAIRAQRSNMFRNTIMTFFVIILCICIIIILFYQIYRSNIKQLENKASFATHLYNSVPSGIVQITAYRPYKIIDFNHVYMELMGYDSPEELWEDRGDDLSVNLHFNDVHYTNSILDSVRETQGTKEFTNRLVKKDGST